MSVPCRMELSATTTQLFYNLFSAAARVFVLKCKLDNAMVLLLKTSLTKSPQRPSSWAFHTHYALPVCRLSSQQPSSPLAVPCIPAALSLCFPANTLVQGVHICSSPTAFCLASDSFQPEIGIFRPTCPDSSVQNVLLSPQLPLTRFLLHSTHLFDSLFILSLP